MRHVWSSEGALPAHAEQRCSLNGRFGERQEGQGWCQGTHEYNHAAQEALQPSFHVPTYRGGLLRAHGSERRDHIWTGLVPYFRQIRASGPNTSQVKTPQPSRLALLSNDATYDNPRRLPQLEEFQGRTHPIFSN